MTTAPSFRIGSAKVDITNSFVYNKGMMGYAVPFHVVKGVETPLYVRAFAIEDIATGNLVVLVNAEICFYSIAIKDAVIKKLKAEYANLGLSDRNVMLTSQHTHSAPGGYSHYILYNLAIPGFQPKVFDHYVKGTVEAIVQACQDRKKASIYWSSGEFAPTDEVGYNRSLAAYNANPEVKKKILKKDHHLAIDREMKLLSFVDETGKVIGLWNWFGVHTTSVNNTNFRVCSDNKGYAAKYMEDFGKDSLGNEDFISVFAQDTAGDVSPNNQFDNEEGFFNGKYEDDYKSARFNGKLQYKKAKSLLENALINEALKGGIDYELVYVDLSSVEIDMEFSHGKSGVKTVPAATGTSLLTGASDRPPLPSPVANFFLGVATKTASTVVSAYEKSVYKLFATNKSKEDVDLKYSMHGKKFIVIEATNGKLLGTFKIKDLIIPAAVDPTIERLKRIDVNGFARRTPWMPHILPIQIIQIGSLAIIGLAAEVTTMAGQRLRKTVERILKHKGVTRVIIGGYANGYSGYVTTPEEYDVQMYEGGHTIFGRWTLPAYQTQFKKLAIEFKKQASERKLDRTVQPAVFSEDEIWYGD